MRRRRPSEVRLPDVRRVLRRMPSCDSAMITRYKSQSGALICTEDGNVLQEARKEALVAELTAKVEETEGGPSDDCAILEQSRREERDRRDVRLVVAEKDEEDQSKENQTPDRCCKAYEQTVNE